MSTRLLVCILLALSGCLEPEDRIPTQAEPFYRVGDQRIYLDVDPTYLTIATALSGGDLLTVLMRTIGREPDSLTIYHALPQHWLVWLPSGTSAGQATVLARQLRLTPGIQFASPAYRPRGAACRLTLLNRLTVQYRPGVSAPAIADLNARLGTTVRPDGLLLGGAWTLNYPVSTPHTPLEIASYYDRQAIVEWAEPDLVDGCISLQ